VRHSLVINKFNAVLRPLTPIAIFSGVDGIVGYDVVIRDRDVCVVDYNALPAEVIMRLGEAKDPREYVNILWNYRAVLPCKFTSVNNIGRLPPQTRVKLPQEHLVPGSSLKGYVRTAILYHILTSRALGSDILRRLIDLSAEELKYVATPLERYAFKHGRLRAQGGEVDTLQNLYVSDPLMIESVKLSLDWLNVFERGVLITGSLRPIAQVPGIVISDGVLKYDISVFKAEPEFVAQETTSEILKSTLKKLAEITELDLVGALRRFGCDLLDYELDVVREFIILRKYGELLESFRSRYCGSSGEVCVIARLGFMTGHMTKTVDLYLRKFHPEIYEDVKKYISSKIRRVWDEATIKLVGSPLNSEKLLGLGWCELCIEKSR
jgi:CRISPR type III-A-associated RAMP protein Csm5